MSIQIIVAPPAGGKTHYCIRKISEIREKDPFAKIQVVVSNKLQMNYWKKVLSLSSKRENTQRGVIGTDVTSFSKLAMNIFEEISGSSKLISSHLNTLCLEKAIKRAEEKNLLSYFDPIVSKQGMLSLMNDTISELQRNRIVPEQFNETEITDVKLKDTLEIYREYSYILTQNNWINSPGLLTAAVDALSIYKNKLKTRPLLVIDGFDFLTKDQIKFVQVLSFYYENVILTLPVSSGENREIDKQLKTNLHNIKKKLNAEIIQLQDKKSHSVFDGLAAQIMAPVNNIDVFHGFKEEIMMIEEPFQASEVRSVLRQIKKYILIDKVKPGDCAILVPDIVSYAPIMRQISKEMGIPMYFSDQKRLADSAPSAVLMRLLRLYPNDFPSALLLPVLRSPFLSGCPDPNDGGENSYGKDFYFLDKISKDLNIIGTKEEWINAFDTLKVLAEKNVTKSDEEKRYNLPSPEKISRIRNSFIQLTEYLTPLDGLHSRKVWTDWLNTLLDKIHFYAQLTDQNGIIFLNAFRVIIKRMVFSEEKLSLPELGYDDFLYELDREINSTIMSIQGSLSDHVYVGEIDRAAGCRWKVAALMGFSESLFPKTLASSLILTDDLRKQINMPDKPEQSLYLLYALTRSEKALIISRPQKTDKGEDWPSSIYWQSILNILYGSEIDNKSTVHDVLIKLVSEGKLITPVNAFASDDELVFASALNEKYGAEGIPDQTGIIMKKKLENASAALERLRSQESGYFGQFPNPALREILSNPEKDAIPYSCSAIELYLNCPFRYFLSKKLNLEKTKLPGTGMDAAQLGSLNHLVMERTFPAGTVYRSAEEAIERAKKVIPGILESAAEEFGFRISELWQFEKEKLSQKLLDSIEAMFKDQKIEMNSRWKSLGEEVPFGYPDKGKRYAEPLQIHTKHGCMKIHGWIDRLDVRDDGLLRVVDYKTGSSGFSTKDLASGSHIQAGIYAAAAVNALKFGTECIGTYWLINGKKAFETAQYNADDENIPGIDFIEHFLEGVSQADYPAVQAFTSCPDYCPAAGWCRRRI